MEDRYGGNRQGKPPSTAVLLCTEPHPGSAVRPSPLEGEEHFINAANKENNTAISLLAAAMKNNLRKGPVRRAVYGVQHSRKRRLLLVNRCQRQDVVYGVAG